MYRSIALLVASVLTVGGCGGETESHPPLGLSCAEAIDCAEVSPYCDGHVSCRAQSCICSGTVTNVGSPCGNNRAYNKYGVCQDFDIGGSCFEGQDCPANICRDPICIAGFCIEFVDSDGVLCGSNPVSTCETGVCTPFH